MGYYAPLLFFNKSLILYNLPMILSDNLWNTSILYIFEYKIIKFTDKLKNCLTYNEYKIYEINIKMLFIIALVKLESIKVFRK